MADLKISQLTDGGNAQAADEFVVARSGANYRIDGASVAAAATSVGTLSSLTVSGDLTVDTNTLKVDSTNNRVGIGTASPGDKFTVVGGSGDGISYTDSTRKVLFGTSSGLGGGYIGTTTNDAFLFITNGSEKARLDASGNLGLGVTPSAWAGQSASYYVAQAGNAAFYGVSTNIARMSVNAFVNSAGENRYISNGYATRHDQQDGAFTWLTAPSGTAGDTISWTQAMTLDASGNLLVGGTSFSNISNYKFVVANDATGGGIIGQKAGVNKLAVYSVNDDGYYDAVSTHIFRTGGALSGTERARITSGGYFKASNDGTYVGSTSPYHELRVTGAAGDWTAVVANATATGANAYGIRVAYTGAAPNGTGNQFLTCDDTGATRAQIRSNGGLVNYQANNADLSDARTKNSITPAASMWDKVAALEIVTYKYNDQTHDDVNVGVIAQQVETVEPVWVDTDGFGETPEGEEPLKTVYTKDITFAAIKALQEAMARIEALEARLEALEA